ncbi:MAG: TonB-dependent receptor [Proteobacteria bacterium]|nr:TonB-dependent receptor [Pseudomonadota bacterium]
MTPIRNLLSDAVRYGLAAGAVGFAGLASMSALAQNAPAPSSSDSSKAKEVGRIEVIGSRIKRAVDTEPTAPVTTMTRADIQQTGLTSTFDVINHISASDGSGLSTVTTQTNGSDGSTSVSLREMGASRTLVLVDGKRWPADANGIVDLSSIPVAIIERIEVLKDGASAIYGSDAIAGVINIVTRKKYEGAQVAWYYGQTSHGDGQQNTEEVTIGANGERSNAVVSLSRSEQKTIMAGDRARTNVSTYGCAQVLADYVPGTAYGPEDPHRLAGKCGSAISAFGLFYDPFIDPLHLITLNHSADGTTWAPGTKASDFHTNNALDRYNFAPVNYLQQPATRNNLYASGNFDITDNVSAYARVSYTQRRSSQQLAQVPTTLSTSGGNGPQWAFGYDAMNIFNPVTPTPAQCGQAGPVLVPGCTTTGLTYLRNVAVGPRHNDYVFNTLASTVGLQGSFQLGDRNFDWEVYGQYNTADSTKTGLNYINLFNLKAGMGPSFADAGGLHCGVYDPTKPSNGAIQGCTPVDLFNGPGMGLGNKYRRSDDPTKFYQVTAQDVANMISYIGYTEVAISGTRGINYGATLSGEILPLQGGMLSFAAGVEQRRASAKFTPDALVAGGGSSDNFTTPTHGETKVNEWYLEIEAPLLKNVPGARELELDAAIRQSDYSGGGFSNGTFLTNNPGKPSTAKYSLRWKPFDDLLLRATWGQTFRAPSVNDLYGGGSENFPQATDPCNTTNWGNLGAGGRNQCMAQGVPNGGYAQQNTQIRALSGGNPFLKPEHGRDFTAGFVWSPSFDMLKGFNLTVDYWRIKLADILTGFGAQDMLNKCYGFQGETQDLTYCNFVPRNAAGVPTGIITTQFNLAKLMTDGVDIGATYKRETAWGTFGAKWDSTYTNAFKSSTGGPLGENSVGQYFGNSPSWAWRSNLTLDWTRGDWDASWTMRYMSALDENFGCNAGAKLQSLICNHPNSFSHFAPNDGTLNNLGYNRMGAVVYHDVQVGWKAPWKAHLSVGARNVFGKEPPLVAKAFAQSFDASYDLPGGPFYYFQYRQDF